VNAVQPWTTRGAIRASAAFSARACCPCRRRPRTSRNLTRRFACGAGR
jgi:hypothetical protein